MRVLHILDHSVPLHSGYTFRTLAILREQRALGWETYHLTSPKHVAPGLPEEEVEGLKFYRTRWRPEGLARFPVLREVAMMRAIARRLDEVVALVRPDILHAHSPVLNALPALRVGRRHRLPVVYEVRALWEDAAVDHGTSREWGLRYRGTRALETYALRRADHVTTICDGLRNDIVARGIPPAKVTVIPNAVDVDAFRFRAAPDVALKRSLGLDRSIVVGFIGSFYAYEGLDLLVEALPDVLEKFPETRLLLVGGGPQEETLKALIAARDLQNKVIFAGRVPHDNVHRYYSIVDVFAYPRRSMRLTELVTPLKPLEAMAQGQLLVASDVGGHRELIRDGETGILFKAGNRESLADAVLRLLADRNRWTQLRARGREFVEQERNWRQSVARYREIFATLAPSA
ncbi:MAG: glycosyltransferase, exosortase A system-associated [Burkholderiales bacterium]|nr:glycosyltransferase, exosortase A system-associated [Burkholderiales bacterium]